MVCCNPYHLRVLQPSNLQYPKQPSFCSLLTCFLLFCHGSWEVQAAKRWNHLGMTTLCSCSQCSCSWCRCLTCRDWQIPSGILPLVRHTKYTNVVSLRSYIYILDILIQHIQCAKLQSWFSKVPQNSKMIAISLFYSTISGGQTGFDPLYQFVGVTHQILHCHLMPSGGCQLQGCSQSRHGREIRFASQCLVKQIPVGYCGGTSKSTYNWNCFKKITGTSLTVEGLRFCSGCSAPWELPHDLAPQPNALPTSPTNDQFCQLRTGWPSRQPTWGWMQHNYR